MASPFAADFHERWTKRRTQTLKVAQIAGVIILTVSGGYQSQKMEWVVSL